jgi:hypothetical protein
MPWGKGIRPVTKGFVMKKELKAALRAINKVLADSRVGPGHRDQLCKIRRELEVIARSGKIDRRRVFLLIQRIAEILLELIVE